MPAIIAHSVTEKILFHASGPQLNKKLGYWTRVTLLDNGTNTQAETSRRLQL